MSKTITIKQLDTGYLIESEDSKHAITSSDVMVSKLRELLGIQRRRHRPVVEKQDDENTDPAWSYSRFMDHVAVEPPKHVEPAEVPCQDTADAKTNVEPPQTPREIKTPEKRPTIGILKELTSTFPINQKDYLVPEPVPLPNNQKVLFSETLGHVVKLQYRTAHITTTFEDIQHLLDISDEGKELEHVPDHYGSNHKTCIRQFMIAVRNGLKPGDSVELDPDKDFRPLLTRSSMPEFERGTLEAVSAE